MLRQSFPSLRDIQYMIIRKIQSIEEEIGEDIHFIMDDVICICKIIQDEILESENDIQWLTSIQNNNRKIEIAAELCLSLSLTFNNIVDVQIKQTVYGILNMEKLKQLYNKIIRSRRLEFMEHRYFKKLAQSKIVTPHQGNQQEDNTPTSKISVNQKIPNQPQKEQLGTIQEYSVGSCLEHLDSFPADPSQVREAQASYLTNLELHNENEPTQEVLNHQPSIIAPGQVPDVQPNSTRASSPSRDELSPQVPRMGAPPPETEYTSDDLGELFLESARLPEPRRKGLNVSVDSETEIHNYAKRAIKLNKNINNERVMVYPGPPALLNSFRATNLMTNPSYQVRLTSKNRSSRLTALYERHLIVEERGCETWSISGESYAIGSQRKQSQELKNKETIRIGAFSENFRSSNFQTILEENIQWRRHYSPIARPLVQNVTAGSSLKSDAEVTSLNKETSLPAQSPHLIPDRVHKDPKSSVSQKKPWQYVPRVNPPSKRWKEFKYVMAKVEELWLSSDNQMITVKQVLSSESDLNLVNYITLIRVMDKLSLQRKLCLNYKDNQVFITPRQKT